MSLEYFADFRKELSAMNLALTAPVLGLGLVLAGIAAAEERPGSRYGRPEAYRDAPNYGDPNLHDRISRDDRERWKDRAEAVREFEKDRREAIRERQKRRQERWREAQNKHAEWEREQAKTVREFLREEDGARREWMKEREKAEREAWKERTKRDRGW